MLPKHARIPRVLFAELLQSSRYANSPVFSLRFKLIQSERSRIGVSVSKKISKSAVVRNTIRRRVYAAALPWLPHLSGGLFLFVAKSGAQNLKGAKLENEIKRLLTESGAFVSGLKTSYNS